MAVTAVSHASDRTRALADTARTGALTRGELRQVTEEVGEALRLALDNLQRAAALGTWDELVDSFAVCNGDDDCGG